MTSVERVRGQGRGFLARLRRDTAGNTLAIMAAALIPLIGFAGSAVDMARLYVVKARLQQACDAGVLAGRKSMAGRGVSTFDSAAATQAKTFFANNFSSGYMSTPAFSATDSSYPFTPSAGGTNQVAGTASIVVPMALMGIFGVKSQTITVSCQAQFDVADGDVMFVLDVTGSMACLTSDDQPTCDQYVVTNSKQNSDGSISVTEKSGSRIAGLRTAIQNFWTTIDSYKQKNPSMNFRYGFVPYNATVNMGSVLPRSALAPSTWSYQSRIYNGYVNNGSATSTTTSNITQAACNAKAGQTGWTTNMPTGTSSSTVGSYTSAVTSVSSWTKNGQSGGVGTCITSSQPVMATFRYAARTLDVSSFAGGTAVPNPTMLDGSTSTWNGCIEERGGSSTATSFDPAKPPLDLDVDTAPDPSIPNSYWGPMWSDAVYVRSNPPAAQEDSTAYRDKFTRYQFGGGYGNTYQLALWFNEVPCPKSAQRLKTMTLADVQAYLDPNNGFRPYGVTYHDVGMTWGTRLLSPTGMFASDTSAWTGHNPPNRYIIFLTDGNMETDEYAYVSHGIEAFDNRVGSGGNNTTLTTIHNNRFAAACTIAKNHNIKVFVISYALALSSQLTNCASPNQAYSAADSASLNTAFQQIAAQVALLRLSQ